MQSGTILLCLLWLGGGQGGHINRIMVVGQRSPMMFRPGASLRPWGPASRLSQLPPHRAPYLFYRPHRYSNVKYIPSKYGSHPWRNTGRITSDAIHSPILNNGIQSLNGVNLNGMLNGGLHAVSGGIRSVNGGIHGANGGIHSVNGVIHGVSGGIHNGNGGIQNGNGGIHNVNTGIHNVNDVIQSLKRGTPLAQAVTPEYEFVKAASQQTALRVDGDRGPIHTIPAPNLSLSDKPIIVLDNTAGPGTGTTQSAKAVYEVTTQEVPSTSQAAQQGIVALRSGQHSGQPLGFSKATSLTAAELLQLVQNPAAHYHFSDGYSVPLLSQQGQLIAQHPSLVTQHHLSSHHSPGLPQQTLVSQPQLLRNPGLGQHLHLQGFNTMPQQNIIFEHQLVPQQNYLFKPEHNYMSQLQSQLYQRYPGVDFSPISAGSESQAHIFITQDEKKGHRNQVRNTKEGTVTGTVVTIVPQIVEINDTTTEATTNTNTQPLQVQEVIVATEPQPVTTIRVVTEATTEPVKEQVIYAQLGQNVDDVVTTALYTAINEIRAAEALAQISERKSDQEVTQTPQDNIAEASMTVIHQELPDEKPQMASTLPELVVTQAPQTMATSPPAQSFQHEELQNLSNNSTLGPDFTPYFAKKNEQNQTDIVPLHGAPFTKAETANVAYTFVKPEGENKVNKDGNILKGQIVQATITEDEEFNKELASLKRGAPLRLIMDGKKTNEKSKKGDIGKIKLPAKSKLAYDEKTGEPVIRIYASYGSDQNDQPTQRSRETLIRQTSRPFKASSKSTTTVADWKSGSVKTLDKSSGSDLNKISGFGVKLQPRIDDYVPAFDEY